MNRDDTPRLSTGRKVAIDRFEDLMEALYDDIYLPEVQRRGELDDGEIYPLVGAEIERFVESLSESQAKGLLVPALMSLFHAHNVVLRRRAFAKHRRQAHDN